MMLKEKSFFGIEITHKAPQLIKLQYVLGMKVVERRKSSTIFEFERKKFFIDGKEPLRSFDQLAERCIRSIYPIQLEVTTRNQIISAPNLIEMQKKWKKEHRLLKMEYQGEVIAGYFQQISKNLSNEKSFLKSLDNDISYALLITRPMSEFSEVKSEDQIKFLFPINSFDKKSVFYGSRILEHNKNGYRINSYKGIDDYNGNLQLNYHFKGNASLITKIDGSFVSEDLGKEINYRVTYLKNRKE